MGQKLCTQVLYETWDIKWTVSSRTMATSINAFIPSNVILVMLPFTHYSKFLFHSFIISKVTGLLQVLLVCLMHF